jgi:PRTRC genetic system protein A
MIIPVHFKERGKTKSPPGTHYIIARNGIFLKKVMPWVEAVVPVETIETLDDEQPEATLLLPPLPAEIIVQALKLAKAVHDKWQSEVSLLLHYGKEGYKLTVPEQFVDAVSVEYDGRERLPGALCVGTIHSHGHMSAFHSGVDLEDEKTSDGIHVTLGDMMEYPQFSLSVEIAVNGMRFPVTHSWFEGLVEVGKLYTINHPSIESWEVPEEWLAVISQRPYRPLTRRRRK